MLFCILLLLAAPSSSYKILGFFPFPATSHQNSIAPILHKLATNGHEVVYLTPVKPKVSHPNLKVRLIKPFITQYLEKLNLPELGAAAKPMKSHMFARTAIELADLFYGDPVAQEIIHGNDKYDAVMMESHFSQEPVSALIHKYGCVAIEIATMGDIAWLNELSGMPDNPAYQIDFKVGLTDTMTFPERLYNFYSLWSTTLVNYYHLQNMQVLMDKYFNYTGWESRPPITQLVSNKSIILINQDILLSYPYPLAPNAFRVGGLNILPNKPLPKDLQTFMDEATDGVIYFSLGSNLKTSEMSSTKFGRAFIKAFGELPQRVLMKWESDSPPSFQLKNIMTAKWFPQQDVLAHKNCVLFITHGGYQSLTESIYHGVPVVGIPFFGDQPKNMKKINEAGLGIMLTQDNATNTSVKWAITEVLSNPRYKNEAKKLSQIMRERRSKPLDEAAYWVEFGIKYPNALTPRSAFLSFIQLHQIDIYLCLFVCIYLLYMYIRYLCSSGKPKYNTKKKKH